MTVEDVAAKLVTLLSENPASAGEELQELMDKHPKLLKEALMCLYEISHAPEMFLPHLSTEDKASVAYKMGGLYGELLAAEGKATCKALKN